MGDNTTGLKRPRGVTILAVFFIINGAFMLVYTTGFESSALFESFSQISTIEEGLDAFSYISYFVGFAVAGAMLSGKGWGRTIAIILSAIGLIILVTFAIFGDGSGWFGIIINAIVLWYLRKPHVKAYFGQSKMRL